MNDKETDSSTAVTDCADGTYKITFDSKIAGKYFFEFTINKLKSKAKPLEIQLTHDVCHECIFKYEEISRCIVDKENKFIIRTVDRFGNLISQGGQDLKALIKVPPTNCNIVDQNDGTYLLSFVPTTLGSHFIEINYQNKLIKGCPIRVRVFGNFLIFSFNILYFFIFLILILSFFQKKEPFSMKLLNLLASSILQKSCKSIELPQKSKNQKKKLATFLSGTIE